MMWRTCFFVTTAVLALSLASAAVSGASDAAVEWGAPPGDAAPRTIPSTVWFQGFLADVGTGDPVNATYDIEAELYTVENGGSPTWGPESHSATPIVEGWFNIELGSSVPLPEFDSPPYYLELTVNGEELSPRQKLASVPTALRSSLAEEDDGDWTISGDDVYRLTGDVGIGDSTPDYKLDVEGAVGATTYYGDGSNLTGIAGTDDNDWTIDGNDIHHIIGKVGIGMSSMNATLDVDGAGTQVGGVPGWSEVVSRFHRNGNSHTGLSIDATSNRDAILYLADGGQARWDIRNDVSEDSNFEMRFHGWGGATQIAASVDSTGRWGFGTRTPDARVDIEFGADAEALQVRNTSAGGVSRLVNIVRDQPSSNGNDMLQIKMAAGSHDGAEFIECERGTEVPFRVKGNGNVLTEGNIGIGTTTPDARIHIIRDSTVDPLRIEHNGVTSLFVSEFTGYVGCGTEFPNATLEAEGEAVSNPALLVQHKGNYGSVAVVNSPHPPDSGDDILSVTATQYSALDFQFIECSKGFFTPDDEFKVNGDGNVYADGGYYGPADFSEMIAVGAGASTVEPGDVMVVDPARGRSVARSSSARSTLVAGIYCARPGFVGSPRDWDKPAPSEADSQQLGTYSLDDMAAEFNEVPVAVVGIVPCKVSAENGVISPGDLLVTSSTPGHAMRDDAPVVGTVIGKALGSLQSGEGVIDVLVTLQ